MTHRCENYNHQLLAANFDFYSDNFVLLTPGVTFYTLGEMISISDKSQRFRNYLYRI